MKTFVQHTLRRKPSMSNRTSSSGEGVCVCVHVHMLGRCGSGVSPPFSAPEKAPRDPRFADN